MTYYARDLAGSSLGGSGADVPHGPLVARLEESLAYRAFVEPLSRAQKRGRFPGLTFKYAIDLVAAFVLLLLTAPILLAAMVAIRITSPGPAIFVQQRVGYGCRRFNMYKLRTMRTDAELCAEDLCQNRLFFKLKNDPRVTPVGWFLRRTSIDELPQFINVLRGEMSLVGPRPLLISDFRKFPKDQQLLRFAMRPGLTGLWQVSGRSETSDQTRINLDLEYVTRWSPWLDLKILLRTVPALLSGRGAS